MKPLRQRLFIVFCYLFCIAVYIIPPVLLFIFIPNEGSTEDLGGGLFALLISFGWLIWCIIYLIFEGIAYLFKWIITGKKTKGHWILNKHDDIFYKEWETIKTKKDYIKNDKLGSLSFPKRRKRNER
jgi:hypothetical protein